MSIENYKSSVDLHSRDAEFNIGDYVMVCVRLEQFPQPQGLDKKLQTLGTAHTKF